MKPIESNTRYRTWYSLIALDSWEIPPATHEESAGIAERSVVAGRTFGLSLRQERRVVDGLRNWRQ